MTTSLYNKGIVLGIIALFLGAGVTPNILTTTVKADPIGNILVYSTAPPGHGSSSSEFDEDLLSILSAYGYNVDVKDKGETDITEGLLSAYDELWLISGNWAHSTVLTGGEVTTILDFRNNGNGLLIAADHHDGSHNYCNDANLIANELGIDFYGRANVGPTDLIDPDFEAHPLFDGVTSILGTNSEAHMSVNTPVEIVATYQGHNIIAAREDGNGRVVFDTSFVRLYDGWVAAGDDPQYIRNIADWLMETGSGNQPPYEPFDQFPSDGSEDIPIDIILDWGGGDPDSGDTIVYDIYFGTSADPPLIESDYLPSFTTIYPLDTLSYNTDYYWKIVARDNHGAETVGNIWSFTTQNNDLIADAGGPYGVYKGDSVTFSGNVLGGVPPYRYIWDFDKSFDSDGDGMGYNDIDAKTRIVTHKYSEINIYEAKFTAIDSIGDTDSMYTTVVVALPPVDQPIKDGAQILPESELLFLVDNDDDGWYDISILDDQNGIIDDVVLSPVQDDYNTHICCGDWDGNGYDDYVHAGGWGDYSVIRVYEDFETIETLITTDGPLYDLTMSDIDSDGFDELIYFEKIGDTGCLDLKVLDQDLTTREWNLGYDFPFVFRTDGFPRIACGDWNGDCQDDLAIFYYKNIWIYLNENSNNGPHIDFDIGCYVEDLIFADIDADSCDELFYLKADIHSSTPCYELKMRTRYNSEEQDWRSYTLLDEDNPLIFHTNFLASGDWNFDGKGDIGVYDNGERNIELLITGGNELCWDVNKVLGIAMGDYNKDSLRGYYTGESYPTISTNKIHTRINVPPYYDLDNDGISDHLGSVSTEFGAEEGQSVELEKTSSISSNAQWSMFTGSPKGILKAKLGHSWKNEFSKTNTQIKSEKIGTSTNVDTGSGDGIIVSSSEYQVYRYQIIGDFYDEIVHHNVDGEYINVAVPADLDNDGKMIKTRGMPVSMYNDDFNAQGILEHSPYGDIESYPHVPPYDLESEYYIYNGDQDGKPNIDGKLTPEPVKVTYLDLSFSWSTEDIEKHKDSMKHNYDVELAGSIDLFGLIGGDAGFGIGTGFEKSHAISTERKLFFKSTVGRLPSADYTEYEFVPCIYYSHDFEYIIVDYWIYTPSWDDVDVTVYCPVDISIIDPFYRVINKTCSYIPGSSYHIEDFDGDGELDSRISLTELQNSEYQIIVTPKDGATPDETFTLKYSIFNREYVIIENQTIGANHNFSYSINMGKHLGMAPTTRLIVKGKLYNNNFVNSQSNFYFLGMDNESGVNTIFYRIWYSTNWYPIPGNGYGINSNFTKYNNSFSLSGEGEHYLEYYSVDNVGNVEIVHNETYYVDDTPPEITVLNDPTVLWPPNHKYHTIELSDFIIDVFDGCDDSIDIDDVIITNVSSDEPENGIWDGNTWDDIVILDSQTVKLRAERNELSNGRVYTINFEVEDWLGNTAIDSFKIMVPVDYDTPAVDDGPDAGYTVYYP